MYRHGRRSGQVGFVLGHSGYGSKWAGPKISHFKQVGSIGLAHIFRIKKKTNKCQLFRENESNQIVRLFVTNLLLYM